MKFKEKAKAEARIPTASVADIVFLLLIFFMVVTVFKQYQGLRVQLPAAKSTQKLEVKRNIVHLWIDRSNKINIDDVIVSMGEVYPVMYQKLQENPAVIVSLQVDKGAEYGYVAHVMEELKKANALRVNFATLSLSRGEG